MLNRSFVEESVDAVHCPGERGTILDILDHRAENSPDRVAFTFLANGDYESQCLTYSRLRNRALAIAAMLQSFDTRCDADGMRSRALLLYPPGLEFVAAFFGCLYARFLAVPLYAPHPRRHDSRFESVITDCTPTVILTERDPLGRCKQFTERYADTMHLDAVATDDVNVTSDYVRSTHAAHLDDLAFLQYSSGSTSRPKGIMVTHGNIVHNAHATRNAMAFDDTSVIVSWLPVFHDMGLIGGIVQPLYSGTPCYLMPPGAFFQRPVRWLKAIGKYGATHSGGPSSGYALCVKSVSEHDKDSIDLSTWRLAWNGAEPVCTKTLDAFAKNFARCGFKGTSHFPCYGLAESTLMVTGGPSCRNVPLFRVDSCELQASPHRPHHSGKKINHTAASRAGHSSLTPTLTVVAT